MNEFELRMLLLGGVTILQGTTAVSGLASRKAEALLVYLACNPRPHPRETLATLLWPQNDQNRALANLSVALASLRKQLAPFLLIKRHTIGFNAEADFWLDTAVFEQAITQAGKEQQRRGKLNRAGAAQLAKAVSLYKGDFLAGFAIRKAAEFEAWTFLEQERLRQMLLTGLADLVTFYQQREQISESISYAQQLLTIDPLQETIHCQLMILYVQDNQRPAALAQYEQCVRILDEELGVQPDDETTALYEQIRDNKITPQKGHLRQESPLFHKKEQQVKSVALAKKHNLPGAITSFIGREAELMRINEWLVESNGRLLTIVGPGGIGKTRLALEAARTHLGEFADGIWYVSLVPLSDFNGLIAAVAEAIDLPLANITDPQQTVLNHLQNKEMLLLLDNFEHLINEPSKDLLSELVQRADDLKLIITSRERLNLQAESLLPLRGLSCPTADDQKFNVSQFAAVQLFMSRIQQLRPDLELIGHETAVSQLCQMVDGLPLALELAASWIRVLSIPEILAEIQRNLDILATTMRDLPPRHRSVKAVFDYSWQLLSSAEQDAFAKLSVFRGGIPREAAGIVAEANIMLLTGLVDKSLLHLDEAQITKSRYRRHPLLLQYATQKFKQHPEQTAVWEAHARYFGRFMKEQEANLLGGAPEKSLGPIRTELENIKQAWQWAVAQQDAAIINQMSDSIMQGFDLLGLYFDAQGMAQQAVDAFATVDLDNQETAVAYGRTLGLAAAFDFRLGEYEQALAHSRKSLTILMDYQPHIAYAHSLVYAGATYFGLGKFAEVRRNWQAANDAYEAVNSLWGQTIVSTNLAELEIFLGQQEVARRYAEQGYTIAKSMGNYELMGSSLVVMSTLLLAEGDLETAYHYAEEAVFCYRQIGHQAHLANALANLGKVAFEQKRLSEAHDHLAESVAILQEYNNHLYLMTRLLEFGRIRQAMGDLDGAKAAFGTVLGEVMGTQSPEFLIQSLAHLAGIYSDEGQHDKAVILAEFVVNHTTAVAEVQSLANQVLQKEAHELDVEELKALQQQAKTTTIEELAQPILLGKPQKEL